MKRQLGVIARVIVITVRARLVAQCEDWPWSSTRALIAARDDRFVTVGPALQRVGDFAAFLSEDFNEALTYAAIRRAEGTGRPVGSPEWLADMEEQTGRILSPQKRGPKQKGALGLKEPESLTQRDSGPD